MSDYGPMLPSGEGARPTRAACWIVLLVGSLLLACAGGAHAALRLTRLGTFTSPVHVASAPGDADRIFVVEQAGRVRLIHDGQTSLFLDVSDVVRGFGPPDNAGNE